MVRTSTIEKHVKFLNAIKRSIKKNNGRISLANYAKTYRIGHGHLQMYKNNGLITKVGHEGRTPIFEFKRGIIEPIAIRHMLDIHNNLNYTAKHGVIVSKHDGVINMNKEVEQEVAPKTTSEIKPKRKYTPKTKVNKVGIIRSFFKWIW